MAQNEEKVAPGFLSRRIPDDRRPRPLATLDEVGQESERVGGDPYAPVRPPMQPPSRTLQELANVLDPEKPALYGVAVCISDLKFHDLMKAAEGIIGKSEKLKDLPVHELAIALSAWGLAERTKPSGE